MPPEAFTPSFFGATVFAMSAMSSAVAPPLANPVEVFTKSAPAFMLNSQARTFSSSVSSAVSRITLLSARPSLQASTTARMSRSTSASSSLLSAPMLMTMSISLRALADRLARLERLDLGRLGAQREADDAAELHRRAAQERFALRDVGRVDADRVEAVPLRLVAELLDVGRASPRA